MKHCDYCGKPIMTTHLYKDNFEGMTYYHFACLKSADYVFKNGMWTKMWEDGFEIEVKRQQQEDYDLIEIIELFKDEIETLNEANYVLKAKIELKEKEND